MEKFYQILSESILFSNLNNEEITKLCSCLTYREREVPRDSFVYHAGDSVQSVYLILSGSMHIIDEDFWGNRTIIETLSGRILFGEAYVLSDTKKHLVGVIAAEDSTILEIDPERLFEICPSGCSCHVKIIQNTMCLLSKKIVRLTEKLGHIIQRSTREKLLSYLSRCARQEQSRSFDIPYSRQQLADYLCVDRSALSHELSKLSRDGVVLYQKNHFELLVEPSDNLQ